MIAGEEIGMFRLFFALAIAMLFLLCGAAAAEDVKAGPISVKDAWSRATPQGTEVGVGYLTITKYVQKSYEATRPRSYPVKPTCHCLHLRVSHFLRQRSRVTFMTSDTIELPHWCNVSTRARKPIHNIELTSLRYCNRQP